MIYFSHQGYLRHIIESLVAEDVQLANLVNSRPDDHFKVFIYLFTIFFYVKLIHTNFNFIMIFFQSLYTYETKMALLTRVASTATGSEMLLESSLMIKMAEMTVFSSRPETSNANFETMDDGFMPSGKSFSRKKNREKKILKKNLIFDVKLKFMIFSVFSLVQISTNRVPSIQAVSSHRGQLRERQSVSFVSSFAFHHCSRVFGQSWPSL